MFRIADRGLIVDASTQPAERRIAFFTSLCCLQSGRILCGFQTGPGKHAVNSTIGLCRSDDQGRSWQPIPVDFSSRLNGVPGSLGAAEMVEVSPDRLLLFSTWFDRSDPDRPLFDPVTEGILKSRQLLAVSADEGQTWGSWTEIGTPGLKGCALTGPPLRWTDGRIAFVFESFREFDQPETDHHAAWLIISDDGGQSFGPPVLTARHPRDQVYYWDQRLCAGVVPGEFTALFWTHDLDQRRDLNVHLRHGSVDDAELNIQATSLPGQIAAPLRTADGRLLAFVVDRGQPGTMTLWCSTDNGLSWPAQDRLTVYTHDEQAAVSQGRENIDFRQYWEDMGKWSFGHPALRQLNDTTLLLAWYAGLPDRMSIHWARVLISGT